MNTAIKNNLSHFAIILALSLPLVSPAQGFGNLKGVLDASTATVAATGAIAALQARDSLFTKLSGISIFAQPSKTSATSSGEDWVDKLIVKKL
jgi:hypothetical protein